MTGRTPESQATGRPDHWKAGLPAFWLSIKLISKARFALRFLLFESLIVLIVLLAILNAGTGFKHQVSSINYQASSIQNSCLPPWIVFGF
jgi:hypothetical protein